VHVEGASSGRICPIDHGERRHASAWRRLRPGTHPRRADSNRDPAVHRGRARDSPAGTRIDVNVETTISELLDLGVDGIMSDRLRLLKGAVTRHRALAADDR
jgi:hypothetical protein